MVNEARTAIDDVIESLVITDVDLLAFEYLLETPGLAVVRIAASPRPVHVGAAVERFLGDTPFELRTVDPARAVMHILLWRHRWPNSPAPNSSFREFAPDLAMRIDQLSSGVDTNDLAVSPGPNFHMERKTVLTSNLS